MKLLQKVVVNLQLSRSALNISKANFVLLLFILVIIWMIGFVELRIAMPMGFKGMVKISIMTELWVYDIW